VVRQRARPDRDRPYDASDAKGLLKAAIRSEDPVVFLENELVYGRTSRSPSSTTTCCRSARRGPCARARRHHRRLFDRVALALEAPRPLAGEGIDAEVHRPAYLRPLDKRAILASLAKTNRLIVAEEGWPTCSIASEVATICMEEGFDDLDAPVLRVCNEDVPLPYAANLEHLAVIDAARIAEAGGRSATH
jgi:pyruvate dehydrogenase E1 component beta subunit